MYNVSDYYREAVVKQDREWYLKIEVKRNKNEATVVSLEGDDILSDTVKISSQSTNNSSFTIGGVCASELSLTLSYYGIKKIQDVGLLRKNTCFNVRLWLKTGDINQSDDNYSLNKDGSENTTGLVEMGFFYIYSIGNLDQECDLKLYDSMLAFDKVISQKDALRLEQEERTIYSWAVLFCESCSTDSYKLDISANFISNLSNSDVGVRLESASSISTYRDALGWLSILGCCFFTIGRDGRLEARKYSNNNIIRIDNNLITEYSFGNNSYQVTGIKTSVAGFAYDKEVVSTGTEVLNAELYLNENPFLRGIQPDTDTELSSKIKSCIDNIYTGIMGARFLGGNFDTICRPEIDLGDCIDIEIQLIDISSEAQKYITKEYKNILVCSSLFNYQTYSTFRCNGYSEVTSKEKVSSSFKSGVSGGISSSSFNVIGTRNISIGKNETRDIFNVYFLLRSGCACDIAVTIVSSIKLSGLVEFILLYDGEEFYYRPKYNASEGYFTYSFTVGLDKATEDGRHNFVVRLSSGNTEQYINEFEYQLIINGAGISTGSTDGSDNLVNIFGGTLQFIDYINIIKVVDYSDLFL